MAVIKNNIVHNIIEADADFVVEGAILVPADSAAYIGGEYVDGAFVPFQPEPEDPAVVAEYERNRLVPKLLIRQRITAAGKGAAFRTALAPFKDRWDDAAGIPAGHQGFRAMLIQIGLDPDAILAEGKPDIMA